MKQHRPDTTALAAVALYAGSRPEELWPVAAHTDVVRVPAGQPLARAGGTARQFIAVVDGELELRDGAGRRHVAGPGTEIGAAELVANRPHCHDVTTRTDATLVVIYGPAFRASVADIPAVAARMSAAVATTAPCPDLVSHRRVPALAA